MTFVKQYKSLAIIQLELGWQGLNMIDRMDISRRIVNDEFAQAMKSFGIPVRSKHPFGADWLSIGDKLYTENPNAASWLVSLVYEAWSIAYWSFSVAEKGYLQEIVSGFIIEQLKGRDMRSKSTIMKDFDKKWWLDVLSLQIRAAWDKVPYAIAESSEMDIKIKSNRHTGRLNELEAQKSKLELNQKGLGILELLITEARNIEAVKYHRDQVLHKHTMRYLEVFGLEEKGHKTLGEVWAMLKPEMDRSLEALLATIGILLLETKLLNL